VTAGSSFVAVNVIVLDDEPDGLLAMRTLLAEYHDVNVLGEARTVREALELTRTNAPDVVFLDIQLLGETAFDYVAQLDSEPHPPRLVFVTAFDEFAVRGFECNALDYLLKPVAPDRLAKTLARVRVQERAEHRPAGIDDSVFVRLGNQVRWIPWRSIELIESSGNYTRIATADGFLGQTLKPLKDWLEVIPAGDFVKVHRTAIVQIAAIQKVRFLGNKKRELVLACGEVVPVSRSNWAELREALNSAADRWRLYR